MLSLLAGLFSQNSFIPHGHCYLWRSELVGLHLVSDLVIALAYYSIPLILIYFVRQRRDVPYPWVFLLFSAFIVACGTTHLMDVWTLWHPVYWLSGTLKAITAAVSLTTALLLVPIVPQALALPSMAQLETANNNLLHEILEREKTEAALQKAHDRLAERTVELTQANDRFRAFMDHNPVSAWITDSDGKMIYRSQTYSRTFQALTSDIIGKSVLEIYEAEIAQTFLDNIRTVVETQQALEAIEVAPRQDGTLGEFLVYKFLIPGQSGQPWVGGVAMDITERKALERELLQKQQTLKDFITCSPVGMTLLDHQLRYVVINEALAEANGVPVADHIGKTPWDIVPDVAANLEAVFQQVLTTGEPVLSIEVSGETSKASGVNQDWLASYFPIRSETNPAFGLGIVALDITERKRTELENQLLKERLQFVLSSNPAVIFTCTADSSYSATFISSNVQSVLGYESEEFLSDASFWTSRVHPEDAPRIFEALPQLFEQGQHRHEYRFLHKNGSYCWVHNELRLVCDVLGAPIEIVGYLIDISDAKRGEAERKQAAQQLELQDIIVKNMEEGICLVRATDGVIVYANPKFERMFGYDAGELIDREVSILNYKDETVDAEAVTREILGNIDACGVYSYEVHNVKKDGTFFWCRATTSRFEHPEYGIVYVAVQADVSELKRAELEVRMSLEIKASLKEKEASLREKEVLLQEIHHRVKNNLQIVDGLLQLQSRRIENQQAAAILLESQHRIKSIALVHEKLYLSNDLAKIDFFEYIRSLVSSLFDSYQASSSRVNFTLQIDDIALDIDTAIPCGLMVNELVSNCLKYAFPGDRSGEITLSFRASNASCLTLTVQDNGTGIPDHIDLQKTRSLGLKLVRGLAAQLEGTVEIDRSQGTMIQITFPSPQFA